MPESRAAGCEPDKWTAVTEDGKYSAHFEHTVAVTAERAVGFDAAVMAEEATRSVEATVVELLPQCGCTG